MRNQRIYAMGYLIRPMMFLAVLLLSASCQSFDGKTILPVVPDDGEMDGYDAEIVLQDEAEAEEDIPDDHITSLRVSYVAGDAEFTAEIGEGRMLIAYPGSLFDGMENFLRFISCKDDFTALGISYTNDEGFLSVSYPEKYTEKEVLGYLDTAVPEFMSFIALVPENVPVCYSSVLSITKTYAYSGYHLTAFIAEGRTEIVYPDVIADDELETFIALENREYDFSSMGVSYEIEHTGKAIFAYPASISADDVSSQLDALAADLISFASAPVPEPVSSLDVAVDVPLVRRYSYRDFDLCATVDDGRTVIEYPDSVSENDVKVFIALESERYGLEESGITYTLEGDGRAVFTYPAEYSEDDVATELDRFVEDLAEYVSISASLY